MWRASRRSSSLSRPERAAARVLHEFTLAGEDLEAAVEERFLALLDQSWTTRPELSWLRVVA